MTFSKYGIADSISGMVFDTASFNTRAQTAACVTLQNILSRPLLWFACRHHIGEVVLTNVWNSLKIEVSASPAILIFQKIHTILPSSSNIRQRSCQ